MISPIPIWHAGGAQDVFLRLSLRLPEPCRNGEVRCHASGPFHIYVEGVRVAGGTGGLLLDTPMSERLPLAGAWDSGELEILVVARAGATQRPWFRCEGQFYLAGTDAEEGVAFCTGVAWHARARRQDPPTTAGGNFDRQMATDAPISGGSWEGVGLCEIPPPLLDEEAVGVTEFAWAPRALLAVGEHPAQAELESVTLQSLASCKCVHHDALLSDGHGSTQIRTTSGRSVQLQYDLGRQVCGWPALRLRGGRDGIVDLAFSTRRDTIEHHLRYHCGDGRQETAGLHLVAARYLTVRLTGFDDEDLSLESVSILERRVAVDVPSQIQVDAQIDAAWELAPASLDGLRQETYGVEVRPRPYDWLHSWILQSNDLALTGSTRTARQTLLACVPKRPFQPTDWAYLLALHDYYLHTGDGTTVDQVLGAVRQILAQAEQPLKAASAPWSEAAVVALAIAGIEAVNSVARAREHTLDLDQPLKVCRDQLEACWTASANLYAEAPDSEVFRQWTNGLVLLALGDHEERAAAMESAMRRSGVEPVSDLAGAWVLAAGLGRADRRQRMVDLIGNHWLRRLSRPGSTWRDKRGGENPGPAPGPEALWLRYLLGVQAKGPGWSVREVRPPIELLPRGSALIPISQDDRLMLTWVPDRDDEDTGETESLAPDAIRLTLQVEVEGETHLRLHRGGRRRPTITVNDEVVWRNEKIYPNPTVHLIAAEEEHVLLVLERPGHFRVRIE